MVYQLLCMHHIEYMQHKHQNKTRRVRVNVNNSEWIGNYTDYFLLNTIFLFPTYYEGHLSYFTE